MNYTNSIYQKDIQNIVKEEELWKFISEKTILITGASGLIGTFLVDTLMMINKYCNAGITVYALSRNLTKLNQRFEQHSRNPLLHLIEQDVTEPLKLTDTIDYIIHAASNTHPLEYSHDPIGTITTNVFGTYQLLEYLKHQRSGRFVLLSSVEVYGENKGEIEAFTESDCGYTDCNTLRAGYPESKRLSEAMIQAYIAQYQIDSVIIRLCRSYGPTIELDDSKALSQFIMKACKKEDIVLKSEGKQLFSYIYVADAVTAILRIMTNGQCGEAYNVADEKSNVTLLDIAEYLSNLNNKNIIFELPDQEEQRGYSTATKAVLNSDKLKSIGWNARYSMQEGLERTVLALQEDWND